MKTVARFAHAADPAVDCWIPMPDGARLAARLWLPEIASRARVPTILEVLPYRCRDIYSPRDAMNHGWFAGHGYAGLRIDIRGTGDSDGQQGVFAMRAEQDDTLAVLEWIAAQPWSDGQVGMFGLSWGGFQAIQTAHRAPPQLKAIVPCSFAPDRYRYSQVFRGGCVLLRSLRWSTQMQGYKSRPPDPLAVGERWRAMWLERLEGDAPQVAAALRHPTRDAYWAERAIDYDRVRVPCLAVSGWADGAYVGSVSETLARLGPPSRGIVGPWGHRFPHLAVPGPAIGFLQESVRWFDRWMRGGERARDRSPALIAWMAERLPTSAWYPEAPGRWVAESEWPSARIRPVRYALNDGGLLDTRRGRTGRISACTPQTLGLDCGELMPWFQHGASAELPGDQRADDGQSITFDSVPLTRRCEILGTPQATLVLQVDRPVAFVCVRLCDVAPGGASTRVSYGVLNLTHRDGHERVVPLVPGRRYRVRVPLIDTGYAFARGHRIRVAVSTTYWPLIWPSPEPVTITLVTGASSIDLPVRPPRAADRALRFDPPSAATPAPRTVLSPGSRRRTLTRDLARGETVVEITDASGRSRYGTSGLEAESSTVERYRIVDDDPLSCVAVMSGTWQFARGDWQVTTRVESELACTRRHFLLSAKVDGYEGGARVFERAFSEKIRRNGN